jgi:hypothetical protein
MGTSWLHQVYVKSSARLNRNVSLRTVFYSWNFTIHLSWRFVEPGCTIFWVGLQLFSGSLVSVSVSLVHLVLVVGARYRVRTWEPITFGGLAMVLIRLHLFSLVLPIRAASYHLVLGIAWLSLIENLVGFRVAGTIMLWLGGHKSATNALPSLRGLIFQRWRSILCLGYTFGYNFLNFEALLSLFS